MAPIPTLKPISISNHALAQPPPPRYSDEGHLFSPYFDSDTSSPSPSPASIESFDIVDDLALRRSHPHYSDLRNPHRRRRSARPSDILSLRWKENKPEIVCLVVFVALLLTACFVGGFFVVQRDRVGRVKEACLRQGGGVETCEEIARGYCVGVKGRGLCGW